MKEATDRFEEDLQNLIKNGNDFAKLQRMYYLKIYPLGTDNELGASFQKMAQTIASVITDEDNNDKGNASADFQSAIAKAINDLSATSENLQVVVRTKNSDFTLVLFFLT